MQRNIKTCQDKIQHLRDDQSKDVLIRTLQNKIKDVVI